MDTPWVLIRSRLAQRWGILPRQVDDEPIDEVLTELKLMELEAESKKD